jgi:hypothetical protein
VSKTSVASDFEQSLNVFSEFSLQDVGCHLDVFAFLVITLSVEEPSGNTVSFWVIDYVGNGVTLGFSKFSSSESRVDPQDFADEEAESSADTLDLIEGKRNGSLTIDVGVQDTVNVLESVLRVCDDQ